MKDFYAISSGEDQTRIGPGESRVHAAGGTPRPPRIFIKFIEPYSRTLASICTGSSMIEKGLAIEVAQFPEGSILLSPYATHSIDVSDERFAQNGICLIDGPWECLEAQAQIERDRRLELRTMPSGYRARNIFYREKTPLYYTAPHQFSTLEAAAISFHVLGYSAMVQHLIDIDAQSRSIEDLLK